MTNHIDKNLEAAWKYLAPLEGVRKRLYQDGEDVPTIGAGYTPIAYDFAMPR